MHARSTSSCQNQNLLWRDVCLRVRLVLVPCFRISSLSSPSASSPSPSWSWSWSWSCSRFLVMAKAIKVLQKAMVSKRSSKQQGTSKYSKFFLKKANYAKLGHLKTIRYKGNNSWSTAYLTSFQTINSQTLNIVF